MLDEAYHLISSMPHSGVWGSLCGAIKTCLRVNLAELSAKKLIELEPDSATPYMVLSQLSVGKNRDGDRVRKHQEMEKSKEGSWL
ncbi:hypothetical protein Bca4012_037218 [Brassica carinata]